MFLLPALLACRFLVHSGPSPTPPAGSPADPSGAAPGQAEHPPDSPGALSALVARALVPGAEPGAVRYLMFTTLPPGQGAPTKASETMDWAVERRDDVTAFSSSSRGVLLSPGRRLTLDLPRRHCLFDEQVTDPFNEMWWLMAQTATASPGTTRRTLAEEISISRVVELSAERDRVRFTYLVPSEEARIRQSAADPEVLTIWRRTVEVALAPAPAVVEFRLEILQGDHGRVTPRSTATTRVMEWVEIAGRRVPGRVEQTVVNRGIARWDLLRLASPPESAPRILDLPTVGWQVYEGQGAVSYTMGGRDVTVNGRAFRLAEPVERAPIENLQDRLRTAVPLSPD